MKSATASPPTERGKVTAAVIAKHYATTAPTIYKWAREGMIPSIRFQSTIRFDFEAVRSAIEGGAR
jgi:excisionase family DNA binding protein